MTLSAIEVGSVSVHTTDHRGATPEEIADRAVSRILYVGQSAHPFIRDQAEAFKQQLREVIVFYMKEAIASDRATTSLKLQQAVFPELVKLLD
jgi:hypothetical protein